MPNCHELFAAAVHGALAGATVLTANRRAARQLMRACDTQLQAARAGWLTPDILPLEAWLQRTWEEAQLAADGPALALLNAAQSAEVWERIVGEEYPHLAGAAARLAAEAWRLAEDYEIELAARDFSSAEAYAFLGWAERYRHYCAEAGRMDGAGLAAAVSGLLAARADELRPQFVLYGFDELTPAQRRLVAALQAAGKEVSLPLFAGDAEARAAAKLAWSDARQEMFAAARWAAARLRARPSARLGVVVSDLTAQIGEAEMAFAEVLEPELLCPATMGAARAFDISLGKPLASYAVVHGALLALALLLDELGVAETGMLLRSPYLAGGLTEGGARAGFDLWLRARTRTKLTVASLRAALTTSGYGERCPMLGRALRAARAVAEEALSHSSDGRLRPSEWSTAVSRMLDSMGWARPGADERALDSGEYQAVGSWTKLLETLASLDAVLPAISAGQLLTRLRRLANEQIFRPEGGDAPVQILGMLEAAGSTFDGLWISGVTDANWPAAAPPNPFLPTEMQRRAGVPHASPAQELQFAQKVKARLLASAGEVVWSWPRREEDRELRPSPLLADIDESSAEAIGCGAEQPRWSGWMQTVTVEELAPAAAPPPAAREEQPGGTRLFELQSNCPFRAFAEVRLGAKEAKDAATGLTPIERGEIVERALQLAWEQLRDHFTLETIAATDLARIISEAARGAMAAVPAGAEEWERRYRELEQRRLEKALSEWLELEKGRHEDFRVEEHQREVRVRAGGICVKGRIDRIDRGSDGHLVILDYKTGKEAYSTGQWEGARPRRPQLPLYAVSQTQPVSGVAYAIVQPGKYAFKGHAVRQGILGPEDKRKSKYFLTGEEFAACLARWRETLDRLGESFAAGAAEVDPLEKACEHCHLKALCRVAEQERATEDDEAGEASDE
jgi:probable DNA repair protein